MAEPDTGTADYEVLQEAFIGTDNPDGGEESLRAMEKRVSEMYLFSTLRTKSAPNLEFLTGTYRHGSYDVNRKGKKRFWHLSTSSWIFLALALTQGNLCLEGGGGLLLV